MTKRFRIRWANLITSAGFGLALGAVGIYILGRVS